MPTPYGSREKVATALDALGKARDALYLDELWLSESDEDYAAVLSQVQWLRLMVQIAVQKIVTAVEAREAAERKLEAEMSA